MKRQKVSLTILKMKFNSMKKIFYVFILAVLPFLSFGNKQLMADYYYSKGQYKEAAADYQKIVDEGYQSVALYFNLGNAYYKLDDIPSALLYYEKAHRLAPNDDDINYNIRFANSKTTDKIDEAPTFFLANWWKAFILSFSVGTLSVLSIILVLLASTILVVYFFTGSVAIKKSSFYGSIALFLLGIIIVFMAIMQTDYFTSHRQAIVFSNSSTVKSGPVDKSNTLFVIHDGTKVDILDNTNGWMKIRLANGNEGWINGGDVKEI